MIAKVVRGYRPGGLLTYLFGPGSHEEHRNPRVVASWDDAPWLHQPDQTGAGEFDLDLRALIATMQQEPLRIGLPVRTPPVLPADWRRALVGGGRLPASAPGWARLWRYDAKLGEVVLRPGYVWHCSVRLAPGDRTLTDAEWEHVAGRLMRATGIQQAGCRWVAVRHADDHVHLMATLVSETTGKRFHPYRDFLQLRQECRRLEREYQLTETAPADRTARAAPTRGEIAKALRAHRSETARDELHRLVSYAAASCHTGEQFLAWLRERGLNPRVRIDPTGKTCGYSVALPGNLTPDRAPVRYAGRTLAPDLSWTRLQARWAAVPPGREPLDRRTALHQVTTLITHATSTIRDHPESAAGVAHATGELLRAFAKTLEQQQLGPLTQIAHRYDRATRTPYTVLPNRTSDLARELRSTARRLADVGVISGRLTERFAVAALVLAFASLVAEIAAWQHRDHRPHQATAGQGCSLALTNTIPAEHQDRTQQGEQQVLRPVDPRPASVAPATRRSPIQHTPRGRTR